MKNKTRNNKRKPLLVVALVLMVALVLGMGAMTYSRYISTTDMGDASVATVAKWGYVVSIDAQNMFGEEYKDGTVVADANENNDVRAVADSSGNKALIIAPGTSGSMTITVNGTAEVLAQLLITVNDSQDVSLKENGTPYNPIKWTLKEKIGAAGTETTVVSDKTLADIVAKLNTYNSTINASESINNTYTISWSWALDSTDHEYDDADTVLGLAANEAKTEPYIHNGKSYTEIKTVLKLDISVTIKQIQSSETTP